MPPTCPLVARKAQLLEPRPRGVEVLELEQLGADDLVALEQREEHREKLERAANDVFRFGKAVLRVTPANSLEYLPVALRHTLPHLPKDKASALVCSRNTCLPPTNDPEELKRLLQKGIAGTATG